MIWMTRRDIIKDIEEDTLAMMIADILNCKDYGYDLEKTFNNYSIAFPEIFEEGEIHIEETERFVTCYTRQSIFIINLQGYMSIRFKPKSYVERLYIEGNVFYVRLVRASDRKGKTLTISDSFEPYFHQGGECR